MHVNKFLSKRCAENISHKSLNVKKNQLCNYIYIYTYRGKHKITIPLKSQVLPLSTWIL
jgi:hypothetical protein